MPNLLQYCIFNTFKYLILKLLIYKNIQYCDSLNNSELDIKIVFLVYNFSLLILQYDVCKETTNYDMYVLSRPIIAMTIFDDVSAFQQHLLWYFLFRLYHQFIWKIRGFSYKDFVNYSILSDFKIYIDKWIYSYLWAYNLIFWISSCRNVFRKI